jgi:hypothetical protein
VRGNLTMELSIRGTAKRAVRQTRPLVSFLPRAGYTVHSVRLFALLLVECRTAWTTPGRCQVRKRSLFPTFHAKVIVLTRQARDKHRENSKTDRFLADAIPALTNGCSAVVGVNVHRE